MVEALVYGLIGGILGASITFMYDLCTGKFEEMDYEDEE